MFPQYDNPNVWLAYWNKFGIPEKQPDYTGPDTESWWIDPEKDKALAAKYGSAELMRATRRRLPRRRGSLRSPRRCFPEKSSRPARRASRCTGCRPSAT